MFHLLCWFDLAPGVAPAEMDEAARAFTEHMRALGLMEGVEPLGTRIHHPCMDTDAERRQRHFLRMSFRDRAQVDAAYAHIARCRAEGIEPAASLHRAMEEAITNGVFICWEDSRPPGS